MSKQKLAPISLGNGRAAHAAAISSHQQNWQSYEATHQDQFTTNNLEKFVVVNAQGEVIGRANDRKLLANADGTVRHEDFLTIRDMITRVRRRALNGITDLMDNGLSFTADIGEQLVGFENVNEFQEARQDMNPNSYQNNDTVFTEDYVPNPITHQSFEIPFRQQGFDYKRSLGMEESVRQCAERLEDTLFNGNSDIAVTFNGQAFPIYGYTTHPDRGVNTISDWTVEANRDAIVPEFIREIGNMWSEQGGLENDSVCVYVGNDIWNVLQNDYNSSFPTQDTILQRMMKVAQCAMVKPAEKLAANQVVLVEMRRRTIELAVASDLISVPHLKVSPVAPQVMTTYAAMVQQIKVDAKGNTGIRQLTP